MRARNAEVKKLIMPAHSSYARVSPDQAAIDDFYKQHGAKEAENTGKVFSFNNRGKRSVGHAKKIHVRADQGTNAQAQESHVAQWR